MLRDNGIFRGTGRGTGGTSKPVVPPMVSEALITTAGSDRRQVPSDYDCTHVFIELWGSGAAGAGKSLATGSEWAGGGPGGYGKLLLAVSPLDVIYFTIGAGPAGIVSTAGVAGNSSTCSGMTANGGNAPTTSGTVGGTGGAVTGADSSGSGTAGSNSGTGTGGTPVNGGAGGTAPTSPGNGNAGTAPGGGGSGCYNGPYAGGSGANGGIRLTRPPDMVDGEIFTTSGFQARTVPAGVTSIDIEIWGGGGSGSNTKTTDRGGYSGAYAKRTAKAVTPGDVISFFVGRGGSAVSTANSNGLTGQDSTCDGMTAEGGIGGATGLSGNTATGGDVNTAGTSTATTNGGTAPGSGGGLRGTGGASPTAGQAPGGGGGAKDTGTGSSGAGGNGGIRFTF